MPGAGSNRINEFSFYTNYYTLPPTSKSLKKQLSEKKEDFLGKLYLWCKHIQIRRLQR